MSDVDRLAERTLPGIVVHLLGPILGLLLAVPLYLATDHDFTRENARHVLNWYLFVLSVVLCLVVWIVAVEVLGLPDLLGIVLFVPLFVLLFYVTVGSLLFAIVGTGKAMFGTTWRYPLTPEFVRSKER